MGGFDVNALVEQYAQAQSQAAVAPVQAELDQAKATLATDDAAIAQRDASIADLNGQLVAANATIAQLQAQLAALTAPPAPKVFVTYGANTSGWWSTLGENIADAKARIKKALGGRLPSIRVWPSGIFTGTVPASYADPDCQRYVIEIGNGYTDAQLDVAFKNTPARSVFVPIHEPENKVTPAVYQAYAAQVGAAHVRSGRADVTVALMLMGNTYDPKRNSVNPGGGLFWDQWIPAKLPAGVDAIGGDLYPWGASDAKADTAAYVIGSAQAAAAKMGVPFYVGEFGCGSPKWSDAVRAKYTADAFDIFDANPAMFPVVDIFEADNGSSGPWCILPHPDGTGGYPLTTAVVAKRFAAVPTA